MQHRYKLTKEGLSLYRLRVRFLLTYNIIECLTMTNYHKQTMNIGMVEKLHVCVCVISARINQRALKTPIFVIKKFHFV